MKPARNSPTRGQMKIDGEYKWYIITCSLRYQKVSESATHIVSKIRHRKHTLTQIDTLRDRQSDWGAKRIPN